MKNYKALFTLSFLVFIFNILGKAFGFFREIIIAKYYGATAMTDAYLVASTVPNYTIYIVSGALSTVIIPIYSKYKNKINPLEFDRIFSSLINQLFLISVLITFVGMIFSDKLIALLAPGMDLIAQEYASNLLKIMVPLVIVSVMTSLVSGMLNANSIFVVTALSPLILNVCSVIVLILYNQSLGIYAIAIGTLLGGIISFIVLVPFLKKIKFKYKFIFELNEKHREMYHLMLPMIFSMIVIQGYMLTNQWLASGMGEGTIASINYASKIIGLPEAIFLAISTVLFPKISEYLSENKRELFIKSFDKSVGIMIYMLAAIVVLLLVNSDLVVSIIYTGGAFQEDAVRDTTICLQFLSVGLIGLGLNPLLNRILFANHDTKSPLIATIISSVLNIILSVVLSKHLGFKGIAVANSVSLIINIVFLFIFINRKVYRFRYRDLFLIFIKMLVISTLMYKLLEVIKDALSIINFSELIILVIQGFITLLIYLLTYILFHKKTFV